MSILSVNLKHFYQRRGLWQAYLVFGLLVFASLTIAFDRPSFMGFVALQFIIGLCTASMPIQILTKPFSYCLPGHRRVPRKFIFSVGVVTNLLSSLVFLAYVNLWWWQWVPATCSIFCAGLALYLIGAALVFGVRNSGSILWLPVLLSFGAVFLDLHIAAERFIVEYPLVIVFLGLATGATVWVWLGNSNGARRFCAIPMLGFLDIWDPDKVKEYARKQGASKWDKLKNHPDPWVERFFLGRMKNCDHLGPGRYIWGGLYTTYGMALSRWKGIPSSLLFALAMVLYLSYSRLAGTDILFFMGGVMVTHMRLPVYSTMTISTGRNERFSTAIILAGTTAVLVTAAIAVVVAISMALAPIMPDIPLRGENLTFHAGNLRFLVVPSIIVTPHRSATR